MEEILEYSIQAETLKNTANAIREYVTFLKHSIDSSVGAEGNLIDGAVSVAYTICEDEELYDPMIGLDSIFTLQSYGFEEDKDGNQVLVLYDAPQELISEADKFYYVKRETYEGQEYDKWRKISPDTYTWDTLAKCYIYTNQIVVIEEVFEEINPVDFPDHIGLVYGQGYSDGYNDGYDDGLAEGTIDPTTVWELSATIDLTTLPENTTVSFNSAGMDFIGIKHFVQGLIETNLQYVKYDGSTITVYSLGRWTNDAYRTITIYEKITDETFLAWLEANATLISSGGGDGNDRYDEGYADGLVDGAEKVKTEEARYEDSITYGINPNEATITIAVSSGYYAENTSNVIPSDSLEPITEIFYEAGYESGYSDGLAAGGSGTTGFEYNNSRVTEIADFAFASFTNLTKISIPGVSSIGDYAFKDCENLTQVYIPSCESIGLNAFENTGIRELILPGCSSIGINAFANCKFLSSITYQGQHDYFVYATNLASGSSTRIPGSVVNYQIFSNVPAEGITFYQAGSGGSLGPSYFLSFNETWY